MRTPVRLLIVACVLAAAIAAPLSLAATKKSVVEGAPLVVGFHDDPIFRWSDDRAAALDEAQAAGARVVRTLVEWDKVAPKKPARPSNPFDPAYQLNDVDELVRSAQERGMEVLITLFGTPSWANGGKGKAYLPTRTKDFQDFATAIAARYSGKYAGYPFVRYYGIWNEVTFANFLAPQYNAAGAPVAPANYAKLAAAGYAGIKKVSPRALVAIGETGSHGQPRPKAGVTDSIQPARFARLVAEANPRLKFDAWAHHPYPYPVNMKATQRVKYPNVALTSLPQFERDLDAWFKRKNIPIWLTEYGHETRPGGVTEANQAKYLKQAIGMVARDPRIKMFVWFVFRDSEGSPWESGLQRSTGANKPAFSQFVRAVKPTLTAPTQLSLPAGARNPVVNVPLRSFCANNGKGSKIGALVVVKVKGKKQGSAAPTASLGSDCGVNLRVPLTVAKNTTYDVDIDLNSRNGNTAHVRLRITSS